ncbi:MAG: carboxylating nicotinate-nucleotide diphosphorylase [Desulfobacterales bacterium]|nr:carboxylating nicotinate-nucleotide diphosphorylase [Desulfobacterales bacterium]MDD4072634.1 carboxylating nicotinate-nucleotide diphosphorylase [Desulfobacterales bacterium]MDD4391470.1 carboxylating nicotinate-nucleotide diphosphorylase [Desulfobacterales bacterium]
MILHDITHLIDIALKEDIGSGDITTDNLVAPELKGKGRMVAKESMILAGLDIAKQVFLHLQPDTVFRSGFSDGDIIRAGDILLEIEGQLRTLLIGERTALNFLQRMSGISTNVRSYVNALSASKVRLVDTRKTTPGWRTLEKYAVRVGGGYNHRIGLYDGILIKDNHIAVSGGITNAVSRIRKKCTHLLKIEVETTNLTEVQEALDTKVEVIMLDNMTVNQIKEAVRLIGGRALVEVSGGVTLEALAALADTGIDIISSGALTHSARSMDISMSIDPLDEPS